MLVIVHFFFIFDIERSHLKLIFKYILYFEFEVQGKKYLYKSLNKLILLKIYGTFFKISLSRKTL